MSTPTQWKATCPVCNTSLKVPMESRGQVVECFKCHHSVPVPVLQPMSAAPATWLAVLFVIALPGVAAVFSLPLAGVLLGLSLSFVLFRAAILVPDRLARIERILSSPF